jgi:hypothetical protein
MTSRLVAQTTEDTGLVPAGVTAARPGPGEALPGGEADPLEEPEHAATAIAHAATIAVIAARLYLCTISTPRPIIPVGQDQVSRSDGINPCLTRFEKPGVLDLIRSLDRVWGGRILTARGV